MGAITVKAPEGTFYADYNIHQGKCFAIFEHDSRVTTRFVCKTNKTNADWRTFEISYSYDSNTNRYDSMTIDLKE